MFAIITTILGTLTCIALGVQIWQFWAAMRFPLHRPKPGNGTLPGISILKPLKGKDEYTQECLESWFAPEYLGEREVLFGVHDPKDPVCESVRTLLKKYPDVSARLVVCGEILGINAKVSTLIQLRSQAIHPVLVVSDADVKIPTGALEQLIAPLLDPTVGMVNCFYRLANPTTWAMHWEAVSINADFWSQVLQSITLKPQDFALGAAMSLRSKDLIDIGGFEGLADHLADDYQLGNRITQRGLRIALSPIPVECWDNPGGWASVWQHQLRWNRTIRVCQPAPYAASILSNLGLWTVVWVSVRHDRLGLLAGATILATRMLVVGILSARIEVVKKPWRQVAIAILAPIKDLFGAALWAAALFGNRVIWRGVTYRVQPDGRLVHA
jgi:ceramide glucosyltransferase